MTRFSGGLIAILTIVLLLPESGETARQSREEMERHFEYGWSSAASLIFYGTVAAVEYRDDPKLRGPQAEITIRVDSLQRGDPKNRMVRVRVEDELQTYRWERSANRIGETGIWFVHRLRRFEGGAPRGYLIRYMDQQEMDEDPQFLAELMKYVIQDTVDQVIRPNILNILGGSEDERGETKIEMALSYDEYGILNEIEIKERSKNTLFNDHVFDTVLQIHRRIRVPGQVRGTIIEVRREVL